MKQEEYILGAAMLNQNAALDLIETIKKPEAFTSELRQGIYKAILSLFEAGKTPDMINTPTEATKYLKKPENELMGYIIDLTNQVSGTSNTKELSEYVWDQYLKRRLETLAPYLQEVSKSPESYQEIAAKHISKLDEIDQETESISELNLMQMVEETKEQVKLQALTGGIIGLKTGIKELDEKTGGLQDGHLITIAGRPGMGKSVLALNIAMANATEPVLFFSREMTASELIKRAVAANSDFTMAELFTYHVQDNRLLKFNEAANKIGQSKLIIDETSYRLSDIVYRVRKEARKGLKLVVIDYLQLLEGQVKGGNDTANLTKITRILKQLAKELNIPIVMLSQLNRDVEHRPKKVPLLSDLKQTGSIEEDSNMVIFCYRPEYYDIPNFEDGEPSEGLAELIVAKNRNGNTGAIRVGFAGNKARFYQKEAINYDEPQF